MKRSTGCLPDRVEQDLRAFDVRRHELGGALVDRLLHVRLGRRVDDHVDVGHDLADEIHVANVAMHEGVPLVRRDQREVVHAPRVSERVEGDDLERGRLQDVADEVRRDESRPAGDQNSLGSRHGSEAYPSPGSRSRDLPAARLASQDPPLLARTEELHVATTFPLGPCSRTSHPSSPFDLGASNPPKSAGCRAKRSITAASRVGLMNLTTTRSRPTSSAIPSNPLRSSRATSSGEASATSCSKDPVLRAPVSCVRPDGYSTTRETPSRVATARAWAASRNAPARSSAFHLAATAPSPMPERT